jgi:hypothetical protein
MIKIHKLQTTNETTLKKDNEKSYPNNTNNNNNNTCAGKQPQEDQKTMQKYDKNTQIANNKQKHV